MSESDTLDLAKAVYDAEEKGYQAGLKRAAEIAINMYPEKVETVSPTKAILQLEHVVALGIEQAILRELNYTG